MKGKGENHHNARLTRDDVELIRALAEERRRAIDAAANLTWAKIAEKFGIHEGHARRIADHRNWI